MHSEIFNNHVIANFLQSLSAEKNFNNGSHLVKIWR